MSSSSDKRFQKVVRESGLVAQEDLERAVHFQKEALARRGSKIPLDRILLKFEILTNDQIAGLWKALEYYVSRKEDKWYCKIALKSKFVREADIQECLKVQKRSYKDDGQLMRLNALLIERGIMKLKEDLAVIKAMRRYKPVTLKARLEVSSDNIASGRLPALGDFGPGAAAPAPENGRRPVFDRGGESSGNIRLLPDSSDDIPRAGEAEDDGETGRGGSRRKRAPILDYEGPLDLLPDDDDL